MTTEFELVRDNFFDDTTLGSLKHAGEHICWTLEDVVRDGPKVMHETAIPYGRYELDVTWSNRFQRPMVLVKDVPGFRGIRMHGGNTDEDTSGCILVAKNRSDGERRIWQKEEQKITGMVSSSLKLGKVFLTISKMK